LPRQACLLLNTPVFTGRTSVRRVFQYGWKGSKERRCPLWATTIEELRRLAGQRPNDAPMFLNRRGVPITLSGLWRRSIEAERARRPGAGPESRMSWSSYARCSLTDMWHRTSQFHRAPKWKRLCATYWSAPHTATACQVARPPARIGLGTSQPSGTFTTRLSTDWSPSPLLAMTTTVNPVAPSAGCRLIGGRDNGVHFFAAASLRKKPAALTLDDLDRDLVQCNQERRV
jgi:hypothetical protein